MLLYRRIDGADMTTGFLKFVSTVALITGPSSLAGASDFGFSVDQCGKSKVASVKVGYCTAVIQKSNDPRILERAFNRRGHANMELNRFADAVSDFSEVIRLNPRIAGYYDNRQNAYKSLGQLGDALNDANAAIRFAPNYAFVYRARGNVYVEMGRLDLAVGDYTTAISLDPRDAGLLLDQGKILAKAGHLREAIAEFTRALDLDRNLALALRERGLANKKLGNLEAASAISNFIPACRRPTLKSHKPCRSFNLMPLRMRRVRAPGASRQFQPTDRRSRRSAEPRLIRHQRNLRTASMAYASSSATARTTASSAKTR